MATAREIEREAEHQRAQLSDTLDALRERMTPGEIVDQAMAFARDKGGAEFVQNLGRQVRNSPLPVALVATGLAWLMLSPRRPPPPAPSIVPDPHPYAGRAAGAPGGASGASVGSATDAAADAVRGAYGAVGAGAADLGERTSELGRQAYGRVREAGESIADQASTVQSALTRLVREQPLVVGAVGLAIGALIGAAMPRSRTEDRLMGETADEMKQAASETVQSYYEDAKEAVGRVADEVRDEAEAQGLSGAPAEGRTRDLDDTADALGEKVAAVAGAARDGARREIDRTEDRLAGASDAAGEPAGVSGAQGNSHLSSPGSSHPPSTPPAGRRPGDPVKPRPN